jgi:hypothetical protein
MKLVRYRTFFCESFFYFLPMGKTQQITYNGASILAFRIIFEQIGNAAANGKNS